MYNTCCVVDCESRRKDVMFFKIPRSETGLLWAKCTKLQHLQGLSFKQLDKCFVCAKHFERKNITQSNIRFRLRQNAVPTLFTESEINNRVPDETGSANIALDNGTTIKKKKKHEDHSYCKLKIDVREIEDQTDVLPSSSSSEIHNKATYNTPKIREFIRSASTFMRMTQSMRCQPTTSVLPSSYSFKIHRESIGNTPIRIECIPITSTSMHTTQSIECPPTTDVLPSPYSPDIHEEATDNTPIIREVTPLASTSMPIIQSIGSPSTTDHLPSPSSPDIHEEVTDNTPIITREVTPLASTSMPIIQSIGSPPTTDDLPSPSSPDIHEEVTDNTPIITRECISIASNSMLSIGSPPRIVYLPSPSSPDIHEEATDNSPIIRDLLSTPKSKRAMQKKKSRAKLNNQVPKARKKKYSVRRTIQNNKLWKENTFEKITENMNPLAKKLMWMQVKQCNKSANGHRFSREEKLIALSIKKESPQCYEFLEKIFTLPSKHTLKRLRNEPGINLPILFDSVKKEVDTEEQNKNYCPIVFDEEASDARVNSDGNKDVINGSVQENSTN